jgi:hypothetical protein
MLKNIILYTCLTSYRKYTSVLQYHGAFRANYFAFIKLSVGGEIAVANHDKSELKRLYTFKVKKAAASYSKIGASRREI